MNIRQPTLYPLCPVACLCVMIIHAINMPPEKWKTQLTKEGYGELWVHTDEPGFVYEAHAHPVDTVHVILQGSMSVWIGGDPVVEFHTGDRLDIPKHVPHSATIGQNGCVYIIGVKI